MKVTFDIPDPIWAQLVETAETRGTTTAHLLSAATNALTVKGTGRQLRARARQKRVLDLVKAGYTDKEVSAMTGELKQYVQYNRARAGLPANRRTA